MRLFYKHFSKRHALSDQLSWTHYRHLLKVENEQARLWYMDEAVKENWSTRALERQINSFYYDRLLASKNRAPVIKEAKEKTGALMSQDMLTSQGAMKPQDVLKDPYVLEFLQLKNRPEYTENELESKLLNGIDHLTGGE